MRSSGSGSLIAIESFPSAAAVVRSFAASRFAATAKSSLPMSRTVTFAKSMGQNGIAGRA
jgi:hypothetical protein